MEALWYLPGGMRASLRKVLAPASLAAFALALLLVACGGPDPRSPDRPRPPYEGRSVELFDDVLEPRAVGLNLEADRTPRTDAILRDDLGEAFCEQFLALKRAEWDAYAQQVSDWELARYADGF